MRTIQTPPTVARFWIVSCIGVLFAAALCIVAGCHYSEDYSSYGYESSSLDADNGGAFWPVAVDSADGTVEVYQPQPESLNGDVLKARAAVSITKPGGQPTFGAAWFTAHIDTDRDTRMVTVRDIAVTKMHVPGSTPDQEQALTSLVGQQLSNSDITFPLDQLMTSLDTASTEKVESRQIQTAPPRIIFSSTPATLISIHGEPKLIDVPDHPGVKEVANTPFILLLDASTNRYYLKAGPRWVSAPDVQGPWATVAATDVPSNISQAGEDLATPPPQTKSSGESPATQNGNTTNRTRANLALEDDTRIIVATDAAELIVTQGAPQFKQLPGSQLYYCPNTEANLFLDGPTSTYYVLLSGRWYSGTSLQGPWAYVPSDALPPSFATIPPDSTKASVLPFVANTAPAKEAVLDASVPQTAAIRRDAGKDLQVSYDGEPKFQPIENSPVSYAVNSPQSVLRVGDTYYCCEQAVWYQSASPNGPWDVCTSVPPEIYDIPPSCPLYNVRYAYVYNSTPDVVYCGYLPGYTGCYVYGPTIVYGTGYWYPGWYGSVYFGAPCTWGFGACYDPYFCTWGFGLGFGFGWGPGWFGYGGWWHDHWHGGYGHDFAGRGFFGSRGFANYHDLAARHSEFARGSLARGGVGRASESGLHNLYNRQANISRNASASQLNRATQARVAQGRSNNVFAGRDGQVYRRSSQGWQMRSQGQWSSMRSVPESRAGYRPSASYGRYSNSYSRSEAGLDRDYGARFRGSGRTSTFRGGGESFHSSEGFRGGGGGGGGGHGGGGRR